MSELAEVKASRPFPYNEYPRKPVTAIRTLSIDGANTCLTLQVGKHYCQLPFTFRATADYVFGHVMRGERLRGYFSDGGCPTFFISSMY
jgi:hypothetical protein